MKVYANPGSGSACIEAVLAELEIPYERILVNYSEDGIVDNEFYKINPRRQIPAVVFDNGAYLTETLAILMHFADTNPGANLAPKSATFERAKLNQWMSFVLANIYEGELRKNYPHRYTTKAIDELEESAEIFVMENYAILEEACSNGPFFFGNNVTILDIYIWMFINWFEEFNDLNAICPKVIKISENVMNRPKIKPVHLANFGEGLGWSEIQ